MQEQNILAQFAKGPFDNYKGGEYSENEGIVEEILGRLCCLRRNQWCVEVGAPDGIPIPNTFKLMREYEMNVLSILSELDDEKDFESIQKEFRNVFVKKMENVEEFEQKLDEQKVPLDFLVLAIDVNGLEYDIWKGLVKYNPCVVVIPVDSTIPPTESQTPTSGVYASFEVMNKLAENKGYTLVAHTGSCIYVRNDLLRNIHIKGINIRDSQRLFDWSYITRK